MTHPDTMRALVLDGPGQPLELREVPVPRPKSGEVLVRLVASPINPSDLSMLKGAYGLGWPYPLIPGLEGAGHVVASGGGLMARLAVGRAVACVANTQGLWAEYAVMPAARVIPLPEGVPLGAGAMSFVNPMTAIALVSTARRSGHKIAISTAAGGALGAMIRRRGVEAGLEIIHIVRREAQVAALKADGAHHVLNETEADFDARLADLCRETRCRMAFDAVGGSMTYRLSEALCPKGEILVYGGLAEKAITLNPGTMIFKEIRVRGFWLSKWMTSRSLPEQLLLARQVTRALQGGFAETRVARIVPLEEAADAPALYASNMSAGKVLIATGSDDPGITPDA